MPRPALVKVFSSPNARRLLALRALGQSADGILQTALATYVLFSPERAAAPAQVATAFAIMLVPYSVVGPFVGVFIDRWSRRTILIRANQLRALTMIGVGISIDHDAAGKQLAALVLIGLGVNRMIQAALAASVPHVVEPYQLVQANALFPTLGTVLASVGAAVALTTQKIVSNSDPVNAALVLGASVLAISASAAGSRITPPTVLGPHGVVPELRRALGHAWDGLVEGANVLAATQRARWAIAAVVAQRFAFGILTVHVLLLARTVWHPTSQPDAAVTDFGAAALLAALGAGVAAVLSATLLVDEPGRPTAGTDRLARRALLTIALVGVLQWVLLSGSHRLLVLATAPLLSFAGQLLKVSADTAIQREIDDAHRGRVFSLFDMSINVCLVAGISTYALSGWLRLHELPTLTVMTAALVLSSTAAFALSRK